MLKDRDMATKENFNRETESLLIAAQNNAIRTNYVEMKIDKPQQNNKCWWWDERDETIKWMQQISKRVQD